MLLQQLLYHRIQKLFGRVCKFKCIEKVLVLTYLDVNILDFD